MFREAALGQTTGLPESLCGASFCFCGFFFSSLRRCVGFERMEQTSGDTGDFCYVRPLATIEPTAIQCSLPVNTHFGFTDIAGLEQELSKPAYAGATVFVAWEHRYLDDFVKNTVKASGGDSSKVPGWQGNDFDSIFVVRLVHNKRGTTVTFTHDNEGLDHLSTDCPNPNAP